MTSAAETAAAVRRGELSCVDAVAAALERVHAREPALQAYESVAHERALREARRLDDELARGLLRGPLHGVPVAVKDLFDVAGETTTASSRVPAGAPATDDAEVVGRLRAAGAVLVGRTRTHEFAWGLTGQHPDHGGARNPHDPSRVTGGSSAGSAATVADGAVPLALATDTAGSIRLPAAWCGLVGHKPTHGLVPTGGVVPLAPSFDVVGALARDVADARLALEVLSGRSLTAQERPLSSLVAGRVRVADVGTAVQQAVDDALARFGAARDVDTPPADDLAEVFGAVQAVEALRWHRATGRWPQHAALYGADVRGRLERAERLDPSPAARLGPLRASVERLFDGVDVLVLPVAATGPSHVDEPDTVHLDGRATDLRSSVLPFTLLASVLGLPACALPAGRDDDGLPVGVQVVGRPGADAMVLSVAGALLQG